MKKVRIYALYHGDTFLLTGSKSELAKFLGVKERTITFYSSKVYEKRNENGYKVIFIGVEYENQV